MNKQKLYPSLDLFSFFSVTDPVKVGY